MNRVIVQELLEALKEKVFILNMSDWGSYNGEDLVSYDFKNDSNISLTNFKGCIVGAAYVLAQRDKLKIDFVTYGYFSPYGVLIFGFPDENAVYSLMLRRYWPCQYRALGVYEGLIAILERGLKENSFAFLYN